jgi:hypothetical protein
MRSKADVLGFAFQTYINDIQTYSYLLKDLANGDITQMPKYPVNSDQDPPQERPWYEIQWYVINNFEAFED